jgi:hypothetical protein
VLIACRQPKPAVFNCVDGPTASTAGDPVVPRQLLVAERTETLCCGRHHICCFVVKCHTAILMTKVQSRFGFTEISVEDQDATEGDSATVPRRATSYRGKPFRFT